MRAIETEFDGLYIVEPNVINDSRGWFMETYNKSKTSEIDCDFVQDNHSYSLRKGTLRGIHFQRYPMEQAKLVRCIKGAVMDYAIDIRPSSDTFRKWFEIKITGENKKQLFIPRGFGHALITLEDFTEVVYKTDNYYKSQYDCTIRWSDPDIGIKWEIENPVLSNKDKNAPLLREIIL